MDQAEATLLAASLAAVVALAGIWRQTRAQRQAARLSLLERRLTCIEAATRMLTTVGIVMGGGRYVYRVADQDGRLEEMRRGLHGQASNLVHEALVSKYLFGEEISGIIIDIQSYYFEVDRWLMKAAEDAKKGVFEPDSTLDMLPDGAMDIISRCAILTGQLHRAALPYVGRERLEGLSWIERLERSGGVSDLSSDPTFAQRNPYLPGSSV